MANAAICAPVNVASRNSRIGSIGSRTRSSTITNAISAATAPASSATISVDVQPSSFPRRSASTSRPRPAVSVIWPAQSMPWAFGSRDSCTYVRVIHRQSAPIGRLTRKIHCQSRPLVSTPPTNGPSANDAPMAAPYAASAPARSRAPGKAWASSASETANMIAAPMPCTARALLSIAMSWASPQASEARVKIARPIVNRRRRPRRSASAPAVSTVLASASV